MTTRARPVHGFLALAIVCSSLGVQHLVLEGEGFGTVLEAFIILSISVLMFYTAFDVPNRDASVAGQWHALKLSVGTALSFATLAGAIWLIWWIEGQPVELSFLLSFATNLGALMGSRVGVFAVEAEERLADARELSKLLSINQRVLRHNIRNELSIALGYLETMDETEDPGERAANARIIEKHLNKLVETSNRTRRMITVWQTNTTEEFDLADILRKGVSNVQEEESSVPITMSLSEDCRVVGHPALPLAFEEAIRNALQHNTDDVEVDIRLYPVEDGLVRVDITDTGGGIPQAEMDILERYEETPLEHTDGVGLWMIYWIVRKCDGAVEFVGNDPHGTKIQVTLPRHQPNSATSTP